MSKLKQHLEYIGSFAGLAVIFGVMGLIGAVAIGAASLAPIPQAWFAAIIVPLCIMAFIQVFGKDIYKAFKTE